MSNKSLEETKRGLMSNATPSGKVITSYIKNNQDDSIITLNFIFSSLSKSFI